MKLSIIIKFNGKTHLLERPIKKMICLREYNTDIYHCCETGLPISSFTDTIYNSESEFIKTKIHIKLYEIVKRELLHSFLFHYAEMQLESANENHEIISFLFKNYIENGLVFTFSDDNFDYIENFNGLYKIETSVY